jgi:Ca-activated chloride channel homolog
LRRRAAIRTFAIVSAVSCFHFLTSGSEGWQDPFTIHSDVRLVLLDVAVRNVHGGFATGLPQEAFTVLEDGQPQKITVFSNEDAPVTVGILVDESQSMTPKRYEVLTAAQTFIEKSNAKDEIFVLNFNDTVTPGLEPPRLFSDSVQELRSALYRGQPRGKTAINDAIASGLKQLTLGRRDRKTLVVISDGGDNASELKRAAMFDMVSRSLATIYAIGLYDAEDPERDPGLLKRLAKVSGGEAFLPNSPSEMPAICSEIASEIRSRYTIGYIPQSGKASLRHILIRVNAPEKLTAHTRPSYRYEEVTKSK